MFRSTTKDAPSGWAQQRVLAAVEQRKQMNPDTVRVSVERVGDRLCFSGHRLDAVLGEVNERLGAQARIVETRRWVKGGLKGFFGKECFTVEVIADVPAEPPSPPGLSCDASQQAPVESRSFAQALAAALADQETEIEAPPEVAGPAECSDPSVAEKPTPTRRRPTKRRPTNAHLSGSESGTTVIIGELSCAMSGAAQFAEAHGLDGRDVLLMTPEAVVGHPAWLCIRDTRDAERRRERWDKDGRMHVVVVPIPEGLAGRAPTGFASGDGTTNPGAGTSVLVWPLAALSSLGASHLRLALSGQEDSLHIKALVQGIRALDGIDVLGDVDRDRLMELMDLGLPVSLGESVSVSFASSDQPLWATADLEGIR